MGVLLKYIRLKYVQYFFFTFYKFILINKKNIVSNNLMVALIIYQKQLRLKKKKIHKMRKIDLRMKKKYCKIICKFI